MNKTNIVAALLITQMVVLGWLSLRGDSLTTDESPHISAGYSYLTKRDMRLNPEHPPLIKDLAAIPLLFQKINFPGDDPSWLDNVNDQWTFGSLFFFGSGNPSTELGVNNPDKIMLAGRTAMLILLVVLGLYIFRWARERYGDKVGLFALFLFSFSPTFLAHGRYVTTDIGATVGFVVAIYYFLRYLKKPSVKYLVIAGIAFGVAQLLKFSLFLLVPFFIGLALLWWFIHRPKISFWRLFGFLVLIFVIGYILVWPVYLYHTVGMSAEYQTQAAGEILSSSPFRPVSDLAIWMGDKPVLRPYGWYLTGLLMVFQRTAGGNTTYFLGDVSSNAWPHYFPIVFLLKEPLPIILLVFIALGVALVSTFKSKASRAKVLAWSRDHFVELAWALFVIYYWVLSIFGNLNIGIRHILPTLPFIYLLVAWQIQKWLNPERRAKKPFRIMILSAVAVWYFFVSIFTFPSYLAYFNELAGGPASGYRYAVDSNLDWGQDLKRLVEFVEAGNIEKIKLDYFGGDSPEFRLGERYEKLDPGNISQRHGWLAVSATLLQNGRGRASKGFNQSTTHYLWLNEHRPVAQIGWSIFVYKID